jgi:hypothetical protein
MQDLLASPEKGHQQSVLVQCDNRWALIRGVAEFQHRGAAGRGEFDLDHPEDFPV